MFFLFFFEVLADSFENFFDLLAVLQSQSFKVEFGQNERRFYQQFFFLHVVVGQETVEDAHECL